MIAEGLFDEYRRLTVDRPDSLIDRVPRQTNARAHGERGRAHPLDALRGSRRHDSEEDSGGEQSFQGQGASISAASKSTVQRHGREGSLTQSTWDMSIHEILWRRSPRAGTS